MTSEREEYDALPSDRRKKLHEYFWNVAAEKSRQGQTLFEKWSHAVLYANAGGVAVTVPFLVALLENNAAIWLKGGLLSFSLGVLTSLGVSYAVMRAVGNSAGAVRSLHEDIIEGREYADDQAVRSRMNTIANNINKWAPDWAIPLPGGLFVIGATVDLIGLFMA